MKRRRLLITGVLLLLGGAIVNVAVAWGCIVFGPPLSFPFGSGIASEEDRRHLVALGWTPSPFGYQSLATSSSKSFGLSCRFLHEFTPPDEKGVGGMVTQASQQFCSGWPSYSMFGERWTVLGRQFYWRLSQACKAPIWRKDQPEARLLPLLPLWPGFAINTIFYAAILWVVFFVPGMVRRRIRRRRGLCPACAYPIGTSPVCTECGATVLRLPSR